jgi:hypothetical protein
LSQVGANHTITAGRDKAVVATGISILIIGIITGLKAFIILGQIRAQYTITAARRDAGVAAGVAVHLIRIIAVFLAGSDKAVTAARCQTAAQTSVAVVVVAIIAGFTVLDDAIAATSTPTFMAAIRRVIVGVIAGLARAYKSIAASGAGAGIQAIIGVDRIAVVTFFVFLDDSVATGTALALMATIAGVIVLVVTALAGPNKAVTATRLATGV